MLITIIYAMIMMITAIVMIVQFTIANIIILYPQSAARRCDRPRWESAREGVGQQKIQPVQVSVIIVIVISTIYRSIFANTIYRSIFAGDYILGVSAKLLAQIGNPDVVIAMSQVRRTMSQVMRTRITFVKKVWIGRRGRYDWCVFELKVSTCGWKSIHKRDSLVHWEFHCWNTSFLQIIINDGDGDGGNAMIAITDICPDSCWPCEWGVSADGQ